MTTKTSARQWTLSVFLKAVTSASCGALASVCGKIAFDGSTADRSWVTRAVLALLVLLLNSVMLSLYVQVLQSVSALQASLLAFVCNYVISSVVGVLAFGERISLQWALGAALMTVGALRALSSRHGEPSVKKPTNRKSSSKTISPNKKKIN